jgi:hypothetical protein
LLVYKYAQPPPEVKNFKYYDYVSKSKDGGGCFYILYIFPV